MSARGPFFCVQGFRGKSEAWYTHQQSAGGNRPHASIDAADRHVYKDSSLANDKFII
jgi:hypothetical protein